MPGCNGFYHRADDATVLRSVEQERLIKEAREFRKDACVAEGQLHKAVQMILAGIGIILVIVVLAMIVNSGGAR